MPPTFMRYGINLLAVGVLCAISWFASDFQAVGYSPTPTANFTLTNWQGHIWNASLGSDNTARAGGEGVNRFPLSDASSNIIATVGETQIVTHAGIIWRNHGTNCPSSVVDATGNFYWGDNGMDTVYNNARVPRGTPSNVWYAEIQFMPFPFIWQDVSFVTNGFPPSSHWQGQAFALSVQITTNYPEVFLIGGNTLTYPQPGLFTNSDGSLSTNYNNGSSYAFFWTNAASGSNAIQWSGCILRFYTQDSSGAITVTNFYPQPCDISNFYVSQTDLQSDLLVLPCSFSLTCP